MIAAHRTCGDDAAVFDGQKGTDIQNRPDGLPDDSQAAAAPQGSHIRCV